MPVYKRELLALNSIKSVIDNTPNVPGIEHAIIIGINEANDELRTILKSLPVIVQDFGDNLGKGIAINRIASKYDFDYLVTIDSDMICLDKNWLGDMISTYEIFNKTASINMGSLCSNQIGNTCHLVIPNINGCRKINIDPQRTLITMNNDGGIAGGCLMTNAKTWKGIGGYRATKLYGTDDGFYHAECQRRKLMVGYLEEVKFFHPYEFDDSYRKWKDEIALGSEQFIAHDVEKNPII